MALEESLSVTIFIDFSGYALIFLKESRGHSGHKLAVENANKPTGSFTAGGVVSEN
jgi:hypothetical protein